MLGRVVKALERLILRITLSVQMNKKLCYNISRIISEEDVVNHVSSSFQNIKGYRPSKFCNEIDLMVKFNHDKMVTSVETNPSIHHCFTISCDYESNYNNQVT